MTADIIGFCRFSFFGPSDTKLDYSDRQAAFDNLYASDRMETRFYLFEHLFLPGIMAQTDRDFRLIVFSSERMPDEYRVRLSNLCRPVRQIELIFSTSERLSSQIRPYTNDPTIAGKGLLQFRCDDDDSLSQHFVARLRSWIPSLRDEMILTLPKGLMVFSIDGHWKIKPMYRNLTGAGYAYFSSGPTVRNVYKFAHIKSGRRFPYISDPKGCFYAQTFTDTSDTAHRAKRKIRQFLEKSGVSLESDSIEEVRQNISESFPFLTEKSMQDIMKNATERA